MRMGIAWVCLLFAVVGVPDTPRAEDISCQKGLRPVYWSEKGPPEEYRDVYVFDLDTAVPDRVLYYSPATGKARWLKISGGGTGVPYRGLVAENAEPDEAVVLFRFVDARPDESDASAKRRAGVLNVMLLDMKLYWPVCARSKEVARWKALAG